MPKTGNSFIDSFFLVYICSPLLPAIIIFLKRGYYKETLNFLMILCLFTFIKGLLLLIPGLIAVNQVIISNIFSLLELVILAQVFRPVFPDKLKYIVIIFLVAFISSVITYYLLKGIAQKRVELEELQAGIIILFAVLSLSTMIHADDLYIFQSPLFWIVIGTLFYFSLSLLVSAIGQSSQPLNQAANEDSLGILYIAGLLRYVFYMFAGLCYKHPDRHAPKNIPGY